MSDRLPRGRGDHGSVFRAVKGNIRRGAYLAESVCERDAVWLQDACSAVAVSSGWAKAHWRKGVALRGLKRFPEAVQAFHQASVLLKGSILCCTAHTSSYLKGRSCAASLLPTVPASAYCKLHVAVLGLEVELYKRYPKAGLAEKCISVQGTRSVSGRSGQPSSGSPWSSWVSPSWTSSASPSPR